MRFTRRDWMRYIGVAGAGTLGVKLFGQGRCRDGYSTPGCPLSKDAATAPIRPLFAPTGWKTAALESIDYEMADYRAEAAFYVALMGWKLRSDDGEQAVLDIGGWGSAVFRRAPEAPKARVTSFGFVIEPWNSAAVKSELAKRGISAVPENGDHGFESFRLKDPEGWDLVISNGAGIARARRTPATAKLDAPQPFAPTGWKTVWLDHFSYHAANYKKSASFYQNLLGWKPTYDEGSQHELMIGEVGDIIIRGGNPNDPKFTFEPPAERIDHISFGIEPWNTDGVKAELEKRGLVAAVDTSTADEIHVAKFKSYHTRTPNGYNLQISDVTHDNRLALPNAVKPK